MIKEYKYKIENVFWLRINNGDLQGGSNLQVIFATV